MTQPICILLCVSLTLAACGPSERSTPSDGGAPDAESPTLTRGELLKPESCKGCHPVQYREWSSSMHAYAAEDPVFLAMNKRGQRETNNALGDFCVRCHAPMAVIENLTENGLNLDEVPSELKGVTCYFCHNAIGIDEKHNGAVRLANDTTMRGSFRDAVPAKAHGAAYSTLHDRNSKDSSQLCGACHDVVTPKGVHMERTLAEYEQSIFSGQGGSFQTCQSCHMDARGTGKAAQVSQPLPLRTTYEHLWAGVDIALTDFPHREAQRAAVECALGQSMRISMSPSPTGQFRVELETDAAHAQPSGSAHDRRMWVELIAYDASGSIVYQSGVVADDQVEEPPQSVGDPRVDPTLWSFRDHLYDAAGREVHFFWEAEKSAAHPEGYESSLLPPLAAAGTPHTVTHVFTVPSGLPARVTARVRMRPIGRDVLEELVRSNDLDAKYLAENPTYTLYGTVVEWKMSDGFRSVSTPKTSPLRCPDDYRCLLDPAALGCPKA